MVISGGNPNGIPERIVEDSLNESQEKSVKKTRKGSMKEFRKDPTIVDCRLLIIILISRVIGEIHNGISPGLFPKSSTQLIIIRQCVVNKVKDFFLISFIFLLYSGQLTPFGISCCLASTFFWLSD